MASRELQITLTSRNKEKGVAVPMCGVPYHAAEGYIAKLIRKGFKVAICEQMEDPRLAKKLVRREVTRVVTPGTAADSSLGSEENNFLAALVQTGRPRRVCGSGSFDRRVSGDRISRRRRRSREFRTSCSSCGRKRCCTARRRRCLRPRGSSGTGHPLPARTRERSWSETPLDDWIFAPDHAIPLLENHFGVLSLEGFGLAGKPAAAASAAGAILYYVRSTQRGTLDHVDRIGFYERQNCLVLDAVTVRNLELIEPLFAGTTKASRCSAAIDATVTPMGKRLLRSWMLRPSIESAEINARLDAVESQVKDLMAREELRRALDGILDLERLLSRVTLETANPRDVLALAASLGKDSRGAGRPGTVSAPSGCRRCTRAIDELADLRAASRPR